MLPSDAHQIRERVLRALLRARTPGFHFPGYFLDVKWEAISPECSRLSIADGPHVRDARGDIDLLAICVFADVAFGTAMRSRDGTSDRLSTIYLQLQFTGQPARGDLRAKAELLHISTDARLQRRLASVTLFAEGGPVCHGSSAFVALETPPDVALGPLPWQRPDVMTEELFDEATASPSEREAIRRCDIQLGSGDDVFLGPFWLGLARSDAAAGLEIVTGGHTRNRVGHVQGGLLLGIAASAGTSAAPPGMRLANVSAWYLSPGRGTLRTRSEVLHRGRNTALVQTLLETDAGEAVLRAVSQHASLASAG
jgi:acyl-coenzyme A thioesterase PaaI-like protein